MRRRMREILALVAVSLVALPVAGQTGGGQASIGEAEPHKSQPQHYTAKLKDRSVEKQANGKTITRHTIFVIAEDSEGRSMSSISDSWEPPDGSPITHYHVSDSATGTIISWDVPGTTATVTMRAKQESGQSGCTLLNAALASSPKPDIASSRAVEQAKSNTVISNGPAEPKTVPRARTQGSFPFGPGAKDLGIKKFHGVLAHGWRVAWLEPVETLNPNRQMWHTQETWLTTGDNPKGLNVREVTTDPRWGKSTLKLVKLSLDEPNLSAFSPPQEYKVVEREMHSVPCPMGHDSPER